MENRKFDVLTKSVVNATSRRQALRGLATGLMAAALGRAGVEPVAAQLSADKCVDLGSSCKRRRGEPRPRCCGRARCRNNRCRCGNNTRKCGKTCITRNQCCTDRDCDGARAGACVRNRCRAAFTICTTDGSSVTFVNGPDSPPKGTGSARFQTGADGDTAFAHLRTGNFAGKALADLETLRYATFSSSVEHCLDPEQEAPYLILRLNLSGGTTVEDIILFEPHHQAPLACDTWQTWNAAKPDALYWSAFTGDPNTTFTLSDYLAANPDATLVNAASDQQCPDALGGLRLAVGEGDEWGNYDGNVNYLTVRFDGEASQRFLF
jgi:hypothetical protein